MLTKSTFRLEIRSLLLTNITNKALLSGDQIPLAKLAKDLGVSVTPVREALTQLTESGIVTYVENRGFFVTKLNDEEAVEVYELIALLESNALLNSHFTELDIQHLKAINERFKTAKSVKARLDLDTTFHEMLISKHLNKTSHKIMEDLRVKLNLHELAFWDEEDSAKSIESHQDIIFCIEKGDMAAAAKALRHNWLAPIEAFRTSLNPTH
ncbi:MAG: GntR family transcriptional regulator [Pseudomonadota bacterium]